MATWETTCSPFERASWRTRRSRLLHNGPPARFRLVTDWRTGERAARSRVRDCGHGSSRKSPDGQHSRREGRWPTCRARLPAERSRTAAPMGRARQLLARDARAPSIGNCRIFQASSRRRTNRASQFPMPGPGRYPFTTTRSRRRRRVTPTILMALSCWSLGKLGRGDEQVVRPRQRVPHADISRLNRNREEPARFHRGAF